jgi:serine/threonine protein phosphatase PrpC
VNLDFSIISETGMRRSNNEDAVLFVKPPKPWTEQAMGCLAIVADGMGGHSRGERASLLASEILPREYYKKISQPISALKRAAIVANNAIAQEGLLEKRGMGTTCTAAAIIGNKVYLMHIGDSRCYLYKKGKLSLLTQDHTLENQTNSGESSNDNADINLMNKHVLTKSLGVEEVIDCPAEVFLLDETFEVGDKLILCTDGLYGHISDYELQKTLEESKSIKEVSRKWIKTVLTRGAHDNFSFILIEKKI